jgi:hypothetical protein
MSSRETATAEKLWLFFHLRGMDLLLQKINLQVKVASDRMARLEAESDPNSAFMMRVTIQGSVDLFGLKGAQKRNQEKSDALRNEHLIWDLGHHETLPRKLTELELAWVAEYWEDESEREHMPAASAVTITTATARRCRSLE